MRHDCEITIDGNRFRAHAGELLLDAALKRGIDLPYDCRAGHCGTCCLRIVSGGVEGGTGTEPGVVHACQSRLTGDAVFEHCLVSHVRTVEGLLDVVRPVTAEVLEIGIALRRALPYLPGQYAKIRFARYQSRPYSVTYPLIDHPTGHSTWFHVQRVAAGHVSSALGAQIVRGHPVELSGPFGSAYFRPGHGGRILLVATSTGFAPIWSIAIAALRENPQRSMMIIAGGGTLDRLYMAPAIERLSAFANVRVVLVCSTLQAPLGSIYPGRPTDYLPHLLASDVVYACGAPGLVETIKSIAAQSGAQCYADPFLPSADEAAEAPHKKRRIIRLASLSGPRKRHSGRPAMGLGS